MLITSILKRVPYYLGAIGAFALFSLSSCSSDPDIAPPSIYNPDEEKDMYIGDSRDLEIGEEASGFRYNEFSLKLMAPDGTVITRSGTHDRRGDLSHFTLQNGLKDGTYRLLYLEYDRSLNKDLDQLPERFTRAHYGLGAEIEVKGGRIKVKGNYNSSLGLSGSGTEEDPYIVSSDDHLQRLMIYVNSASTNKSITPTTYFQQVGAIDMDMACYYCDLHYGWYPIGSDTNLPFRGVYKGDRITNLWSIRDGAPAVGLFGYIHNATLTDIEIVEGMFRGDYAVGSVAGVAIAAGDDHGKSMIVNCTARNCDISGTPQSFSIGGVLGAVDMYGNVLMTGCSTEEGTVTGSYNVGGILGGGAMRSSTVIADCDNSARIVAEYSGAGGIVGACDTLNVTGCTSRGEISGATLYTGAEGTGGVGAGGIVGGSGMSALASVINHGKVSGYYGVGGLIGSTRVKGDDKSGYVFNTTVIRGGGNTGDVQGRDGVGGAMGEGQFGCYATYNTGNISGNDYVGGIAGNTAISSPQNALNTGRVTGNNYVAGIIAKTTMGIVANAQNHGEISATGHHVAGITGLSGNNTIVHFCTNTASVTGDSRVAGIIGEIGDPREWTASNIADCVVGGAEVIMAFLGPTLSMTSMALHSVAKVAAIGIHIIEVSIEAVLITTDSALAAYGLYEILEAESSEIEAAIHSGTEGIRADIDSEMSRLRAQGFSSYSGSLFDKQSLTTMPNHIAALNSFTDDGENDDLYNENLNLIREERGEELEHQKRVGEIVHEVIAGICIVASTAAAIGATVLSGGAAAPFVLGGVFFGILGGVNAISKSVNDFQVNSAVVSQCTNSGLISGKTENSGGIVGELQDGCLVEYCLNAADNFSMVKPFVGHAHTKSEIACSINAADCGPYENSAIGSRFVNSATYYKDDIPDIYRGHLYDEYNLFPMSAPMISDSASYDYGPFYIPVGKGKLFEIPEGSNRIPVPAKSRAASDKLIR